MKKLRSLAILASTCLTLACAVGTKKPIDNPDRSSSPQPKLEPKLHTPLSLDEEDLADRQQLPLWPGLVNLGNTCFLNATLKLLARSRTFHEAFEHALDQPEARLLQSSLKPLMYELRKGSLSPLHDQAANRLAIVRFIEAYNRAQTPLELADFFNAQEQQDANELFLHLSTALDFAKTSFAQSKTIEVVKIINTPNGDVLKISDYLQPIWLASYSIEDPTVSSIQDLITTSYDSWQQGEERREYENINYQFASRLLVETPPKLLFMDLKRKTYDRVKREVIFVDKQLAFNEQVRLPLYARPEPEVGADAWLRTGAAVYQAVAVIKHSGSIDGGHYFAYLQEAEGKWRRHDDWYVGKDSEAMVDSANEKITSILYELLAPTASLLGSE